jgi:site-specific DNA recombinase
MKTAIYLRQSIDRDQTKLAVDRQREDLLKLCAARGWGDPVEYCDNNVSANTGRRIAYQELCDDIRGGVIDRVAVWDLDRLHRQPAELEAFITLADQHHVELASVGGDADLSTASGRLFARMKGTVARYETEHKSARQLAANQQRAKSGKTWHQRMFGYDGTEVVEHEADAIRRACTAVLNGASIGSIATQWNAEGLPTTRNGTWSRTMVKRVLIRPHNAGLQTYHGEVLEDVETPWSAIIERDVWEAVCAVLTDPKRYTGAVPGRKHLLRGLVLCGKCGHPMRSGLDDRKHGREASYVCAQDGCRHVSRNLAKTDKFVIGHITRRLADPDAVVTLAPRPLTRRRYATRSPRCALRSAKPKPTMTRVWLMRVG